MMMPNIRWLAGHILFLLSCLLTVAVHDREWGREIVQHP
jgi:hypothetical protein